MEVDGRTWMPRPSRSGISHAVLPEAPATSA